jgi:hypothetical protein
MTFQPVLPPIMLAVVSATLIALRFISMRQLHTSSGAKWATVWRWCGLTLAVLLVVIAAWRPGLERHGEQATTARPSGENVNVFLVVDRSSDTGIDDYDGRPRIEGIRADIGSLIARYPSARFAMIEFASRASLDWPLSEDLWSLEPTVAGLRPYAATAEEDDAAAAANVLRYQLIAAGQQYRDSANLVFYFGSGASGSRAPQGEFEPVAGTVDGGAVFGYGDTPAYDEGRLRTIAEQLGISYAHRHNGQPLPETQTNSVATQALAARSAASGGMQRTELYWVFTMLASVLMLFELFVTIREFRRMRMARRSVEL